MDVLTEFELKYFETKELVGSLRSKLNEFVEETVDEKVMDERAKKKVDEIWEKNKTNKREGTCRSPDLLDDSEHPDPAHPSDLFEFARSLDAQLRLTQAQAERLFAGTPIGESSALERPRPEARLMAKPKKRSVDSAEAASRTQVDGRGGSGAGEVRPADI